MSIMDTKVSKSGDTMTGNLTVDQHDLFLVKNSGAITVYKNPARESSTIPSERGGYGFNLFWDKNNIEVGRVESWQNTDGGNHILIRATKDNISSQILAGVGAHNKIYTSAPLCAVDNSIVTTASHGSRFVRFGNGLQICWGAGTGVQVFPQPFRNTNYMIADSDLTYHKYEGMWTTNKTTTQFEIKNSSSAQWIAIGYWY